MTGQHTATAADLAGEGPQAGDWDVCSPTDEAITGLARQLRRHGQGMLRGDYSLVPAIQELITSRAAQSKAPPARARPT